MPYIPKERRKELDDAIDALNNVLISQPGEYNYVITRLIHNYAVSCERGPCYQTFNDIVGLLECAKAEFIRTVVSPYEDEKIELNGYVSDLDKNNR